MTLQFPLRGTIEGVDVVIVPASEYDRLCGGGAPVASAVEQMMERLHARGGPRRKILYDAEVARFLIEKLDTMPPTAVREACVERFGIERTPSGYAIGRLLEDVREERSAAIRLQSFGSAVSAATAKRR